MSEQNTIIFLNWPSCELCPGSVCYSGIVLPQRGCCNSNCYFSICGYPFQFCCYTTTASQNYGGHCLPSFARQNDTESPISLIFTCLKLPCSVAGMFVCIAGRLFHLIIFHSLQKSASSRRALNFKIANIGLLWQFTENLGN